MGQALFPEKPSFGLKKQKQERKGPQKYRYTNLSESDLLEPSPYAAFMPLFRTEMVLKYWMDGGSVNTWLCNAIMWTDDEGWLGFHSFVVIIIVPPILTGWNPSKVKYSPIHPSLHIHTSVLSGIRIHQSTLTTFWPYLSFYWDKFLFFGMFGSIQFGTWTVVTINALPSTVEAQESVSRLRLEPGSWFVGAQSLSEASSFS